MTPIKTKIDELRIAEEKASPAPWIRNHNGGHIAFRPNPDGSLGDFHYAIIRGWNHEIADNSNFIALSRNTIPDLLAYVDRLEKVVEAAGELDGILQDPDARKAIDSFTGQLLRSALAALRELEGK